MLKAIIFHLSTTGQAAVKIYKQSIYKKLFFDFVDKIHRLMCDCDGGDMVVSAVRRESMYGMMSVDDSVDIVLQESLPLDVMCLEAHEADGCVLAESIRSTVGDGISALYIKQNRKIIFLNQL